MSTEDDNRLEKEKLQPDAIARLKAQRAARNGSKPADTQDELERQAITPHPASIEPPADNGNEQHEEEQKVESPKHLTSGEYLDVYPYERPHRLNILASCQNAEWYENVGHIVIKPEYFNTKEEGDYVKFVQHFYDKYNRTPELYECQAEFATSDKYSELHTELLAQIAEASRGDLTYAQDTAIKFAKKQAQWIALDQNIQDLQQGKDADTAITKLEAIENIGANLNEWRSPADVDKYDFDALKWLVDGMLKQGKVNLFYGQSGCGKTWMIMDMCVQLALGKKFLGRECVKSFILWIDEENREDEIMERLYSFRAAMTNDERKEFDTNFRFRTLSKTCKERFNLNDTQAVRRLIKQIQKVTNRPVVVVFDSMGTVSYDKETVSDNKQAIKTMNLMADIVVATEATLAAIHHPLKSDKTNMFGGVFMTNLVDLNVQVAKLDKDDNYEGRHILKLTEEKDRKGVFGNGLLVEFLTDGRDDHYRAVNPRFELEETALGSGVKRHLEIIRTTVEDRAITYIKWHPECLLNKSKDKSREDIAGDVALNGVGRDAWRKAVDKLLEQEMYDWNDANPKNKFRVLVKGRRYEELRQD